MMERGPGKIAVGTQRPPSIHAARSSKNLGIMMVMMMMRKGIQQNPLTRQPEQATDEMASPDWEATPRVLGKPASVPKALRGCQVMMK